MRLSTNRASTNVGTLTTDVGDFTTLLLSVNPNLTTTDYPKVWTQYTVTLSGIPVGASGRFAFRYFVTDGGRDGANSDYIGIDTVKYVSSACSQPDDVPWLSVTPTSGTTDAGGSSNVTVGFNSNGLAAGTYKANLCINSNDPTAKGVAVPVELKVGQAPQPLISLVKTVGTSPDECATASSITVSAGTRVYYCYTVTNEGNVTFYAHNLSDDQLGTLFTGHDHILNPDSSLNTVDAGLPISSVINATTVNEGTWRAYNTGGIEATAKATATVSVTPPVTYTISVLASPSEGGTITGGGSYATGATATVTAIPAQGWVFRYWLVEGSQITDNPYSFEVTGNVELTAVFQRQPTTATITVLVSPVEGGTITGGGSYAVGATATVNAIPAQGWVFRYWLVNSTQAADSSRGALDPVGSRPATLDAIQITDNPYSFQVTRDTRLTAVFERQGAVAIPAIDPLGLLLLVAMLMGLGGMILRRSV